jgi:hypothetical protein
LNSINAKINKIVVEEQWIQKKFLHPIYQ